MIAGAARRLVAGSTHPRDWRAALAAAVAREAEARSLFVLGPLGLMIGILLHFGGLLRLPLLTTALGAGVLLAAMPLLRAPVLRHAALFFAFLVAGLAVSAWEVGRTATVILSGNATTRIEGRVLWRDRDDHGRTRYLVAVAATDRPVLSRPPSRVKLLVSARHEPLPVGATYRGLVRLRPPSGPAVPGGYDFAFGAFFEGIGAHGFALGPPVADAGAPPAEASWGERLVRLRLAISDRIRASVPGAEGAVASALITGERSGIPDEVDDWLRATGLSHVLSISGLHMALVAGFAMTLVRGVLALIPPLALRLPTKKIAAAAALAVSAFYLALSGADVATTRSFVMIAILLAAVLCDRPALTLRNIAIAAVLILCITPHALLTPGFQMSFAATAAIVAVYGAYAMRRTEEPSVGRSIVAASLIALAGIAASSLVAGAATAPYAAYHFGRVAPFGLVANTLALPIFSLWIMPLALIAMILMPFGLDWLPLVLIGQGLTLVFEIARVLAGYLPDDPTGRLTISGLLVLSLALVVGCFLQSRLRLAAIPIALLGLLLLPDRRPPPDLILFEDGRTLALVAREGTLIPLDRRPNRFVMEQWMRTYGGKATAAASEKAFTCEETNKPDRPDATPPETPIPQGEAALAVGTPRSDTSDSRSPPQAETTAADAPPADDEAPLLRPANASPTPRKQRPNRYCKATTRSGLTVAWTDDYKLLGRACEEADLAIVARASRRSACRSGATLVTLRSLRRTGSLAVSGPRRDLHVESAISGPMEPWNLHRLAPWPEAWRRPPP